jgi:hypothetical protein
MLLETLLETNWCDGIKKRISDTNINSVYHLISLWYTCTVIYSKVLNTCNSDNCTKYGTYEMDKFLQQECDPHLLQKCLNKATYHCYICTTLQIFPGILVCTSTAPLGLHGLLQGKLHLHLRYVVSHRFTNQIDRQFMRQVYLASDNV